MRPYLINAKTDGLHARVFYDARYTEQGMKHSKTKTIPTYQEHIEWYLKQNFDNMFLIWHEKCVGYIRISDDGHISIALLEGECKKGYATFAVGKITNIYSHLKAVIKKNNFASIKLFRKFPHIIVELVD